ncbi:hypothetical protein [Sphingomonas sp. PWP1-2]|uniref:hypothetical protein n=1 Tax=Sphingomonas sp. PWP1-2 TaxID=2804558 RepID=UPI003CF817F2
MKLLPSLLLIMASACSQSPDGGHIALMDAIDRRLVMPPKAHPLREYARYYARRQDGKIAIFLTAYVNMPSTPEAGERRWIDLRLMPDASDGGCGIINAVYDPSVDRVDQIRCNGPN